MIRVRERFRHLIVFTIGAAFTIAAVGPVYYPVGAQAKGRPDITVSGGGVAQFVNSPNRNGCDADTSNFAVSATIRNGHVSGEWICMIKDCLGDQLTVIGQFTDVLEIESEPDMVFLAGDAKLELEGAGIVDFFDFTVKLEEGLPGTGEFTYNDPVVAETNPNGDREIVTQGHIMISFH